MNSKKTIWIVVVCISTLLSAKIISSKYKVFRAAYFMEGKGKTQHFINAYIN